MITRCDKLRFGATKCVTMITRFCHPHLDAIKELCCQSVTATGVLSQVCNSETGSKLTGAIRNRNTNGSGEYLFGSLLPLLLLTVATVWPEAIPVGVGVKVDQGEKVPAACVNLSQGEKVPVCATVNQTISPTAESPLPAPPAKVTPMTPSALPSYTPGHPLTLKFSL
ncbi:hypothetical protein CFC21_033382 [Triticum aestivum]|uniref:Uncharacterized protein n=2 Tax=Triticum aestivum TaxID=4565 RepID=A0A3B6E8X9_WHEAT|nr:hypothetical protein CFC21_033382 [Triticum aestivum]